MRKTFLFFALLIVICGCNNRMFSSSERKVYVDETKKFISSITSKVTENDLILLSDKPNTQGLGCINLLLKDTTIFTKEDQEKIMSQLNHPIIKKWDKKLVIDAKIISENTITAIFRDRDRWWNYFYRHYGRSYYTYSTPIFLKNYNFCLFYSSYSCGGLCGSEQISLFKKEGETWKFLKSFCESVR